MTTTQVTFQCGWCRSKDQTADVIYHGTHVEHSYHGDNDHPYIVALCRRCKRASSLFWRFNSDLPPHLQSYELSYKPRVSDKVFQHAGDITEVFIRRDNQFPRIRPDLPENIPESVREACLDAEDGRSPRAKCQSYRTAIEFALRESKVEANPGDTLGQILKNASKSFAISDALIELCDQVKAFGNWGLHWSETEIQESDAKVARSITFAILEYLFTLPKMVEEAKSRTETAKKAHQDSGSKS